MGVIGKSEICLKIVYLLQAEYVLTSSHYVLMLLLMINSFWGVFWVDFSSLLTARSGFLVILKAFVSPTESIKELVTPGAYNHEGTLAAGFGQRQ